MKIRVSLPTIFLLAVLFLLLPASRAWGQAANQSRLEITLRLKKGKLAVDQQESKKKFTPSEKFCTQLKIPAAECRPGPRFAVIETELFKDIDNILGRFQPFYFYALTNEERQLALNGKLDNDLVRRLKNISSSWRELKTTCTSPGAANPDLCPLLPMLNAMLNGPMVNNRSFSESMLADTALIPTPGPLASDDDPIYDAETGTVNFFVLDPVTSWNSPTDFKICFEQSLAPGNTAAPCPQEPVEKAARMRRLLAQLKTTLWRPRAMRAVIESYYTTKGFLPTVTFNIAGERWINVQESSRLGRLLLPPELPPTTIDKLLYLLLPNTDFRAYLAQCKTRCQVECIELKLPAPAPDQPEEVRKFQKVDFLQLGSTPHPEPLLNQFQLQYQQASVAPLGFSLGLQANGEESRRGKSFYDLLIRAETKETASKPKEDAPQPVAAGINKTGMIDTKTLGQRAFEPRLPRAGLAGTTSACNAAGSAAPAPSEKRRTYYVAVGGEYKPGQGIRGIFVGQITKLGPGDLSGQIGGHAQALGQLNYAADFVRFKGLGHRRASLQLNGSSEFVARRLLGGLPTDERRMGGLGRFEIELFRDRQGQLLRLAVEGRHGQVTLLRNDKPIEKQHLSTLELGTYYLFESDPSPSARRFTLEPRLRFGLGLAQRASRFTAFSLQGHYHHKLSEAFEADVSGRAATMSRKTPLFEQASFGGAEVVRGFREDDVIGRKLWSLQPELWTPIPGLPNAEDGPGAFFRQKIRLAGFVDVGGAYATTAAKAGVRAGPGFGVRMVYGAAVIKLDWAHGLGAAGQSRRQGRVYFSIVFNRPL